MAEKKMPLRKCIGCGEMKEKPDLLRVVKNNEGEVFLDDSKKADGRGAYICKDIACIETAIKRHGLERSFKCKVDTAIYDALQGEITK